MKLDNVLAFVRSHGFYCWKTETAVMVEIPYVKVGMGVSHTVIEACRTIAEARMILGY